MPPDGTGAWATIIVTLAFFFLILPGPYKLIVIGAVLLAIAILNYANEEFGTVSHLIVLAGVPMIIFGLGTVLMGGDLLVVVPFLSEAQPISQTDLVLAVPVLLGMGALWFGDFCKLFRK